MVDARGEFRCGNHHEWIRLSPATLAMHDVSLPVGSVKNLSMEFTRGVYLVVGPNGVGKTSLLNSIAGTLAPASGRIDVNGRPAHERSANVVLVPGSPPPIPWIRTGLLLEFIVSLYPRTRQSDAFRDEVLNEFGLASFLSKPLGVLSAGTAKKLLLTAALVAAPPVMLFDEPTNEVDAGSAEVFLNHVARIAIERTVLITTHQVAIFMRLMPTVLRLEMA
jgi:ABC-type multidrug transport system ATPase subunit